MPGPPAGWRSVDSIAAPAARRGLQLRLKQTIYSIRDRRGVNPNSEGDSHADSIPARPRCRRPRGTGRPASSSGAGWLGAWLRYRDTRVVVCPENREMVAVEVDAAHAAWSASQGRPDLRLEDCTRWPEKAGCGQECLEPDRVGARGLPRAHHPGRLVPGQDLRLLRPRRSARSTGTTTSPACSPPTGSLATWGTFRAGAGHRRAGHPQAGLLGLPPGGELPPRAPRARHRAPRAAPGRRPRWPRPPSARRETTSARRTSKAPGNAFPLAAAKARLPPDRRPVGRRRSEPPSSQRPSPGSRSPGPSPADGDPLLHLVTPLAQDLEGVRGEAVALVAEQVGQPLVVDAGRVDRLLRRSSGSPPR